MLIIKQSKWLMYCVRNKTIIGLKSFIFKCFKTIEVRNKTIIGLKCSCCCLLLLLLVVVRNKTIIGLKSSIVSIIGSSVSVRNNTIIGLKYATNLKIYLREIKLEIRL